AQLHVAISGPRSIQSIMIMVLLARRPLTSSYLITPTSRNELSLTIRKQGLTVSYGLHNKFLGSIGGTHPPRNFPTAFKRSSIGRHAGPQPARQPPGRIAASGNPEGGRPRHRRRRWRKAHLSHRSAWPRRDPCLARSVL